MLTLRLPGLKARACSGLTLSGLSLNCLQGEAWRCRMGYTHQFFLSESFYSVILENKVLLVFTNQEN
ncbi:MAG: hypothetical protein A2157_07255 [Deltaproteobacteria bacterium RBG_16_47_11]|nr:MAG: hypothetical protein A2157_07255 [Deltaproteobacteria bacterium RBG_16_47_11]